MKFSEAVQALKDGERVTRQSWIGSMYFQIDSVTELLHCFQPTLKAFGYDESIMLSTGWEVEGEEGEFAFYDIISFLQQGKKAKLKEWTDTFIQYDSQAKTLVAHEMISFNYHPDFDAFTAIDWVTL